MLRRAWERLRRWLRGPWVQAAVDVRIRVGDQGDLPPLPPFNGPEADA